MELDERVYTGMERAKNCEKLIVGLQSESIYSSGASSARSSKSSLLLRTAWIESSECSWFELGCEVEELEYNTGREEKRNLLMEVTEVCSKKMERY